MARKATSKPDSGTSQSPKGSANLVWVQHFIHHLAPHGMAAFFLANGRMSSNQSGEPEQHLKLAA